jgi:hypothetical protein
MRDGKAKLASDDRVTGFVCRSVMAQLACHDPDRLGPLRSAILSGAVLDSHGPDRMIILAARGEALAGVALRLLGFFGDPCDDGRWVNIFVTN